MTYRLLVDGAVVATSLLDVRSPSFARGLLTPTAAYACVVTEHTLHSLVLVDREGWPLDTTSLRVEMSRSTGALWLLAYGPMFDGPHAATCPPTNIFEMTLAHCAIEGRFIASAADLPEACGVGATPIAAMRRLRHSMGRALTDRHLRGARIRRRDATMCARLVKLVVERAFSTGWGDPYDAPNAYDTVAQALTARIAEATSAEAGERLAREVIDEWLQGYVLVGGACSVGYLGAALAAIRTGAAAIDHQLRS